MACRVLPVTPCRRGSGRCGCCHGALATLLEAKAAAQRFSHRLRRRAHRRKFGANAARGVGEGGLRQDTLYGALDLFGGRGLAQPHAGTDALDVPTPLVLPKEDGRRRD